jgi:phosphate transport system substrate-binding protein
MNANRSFAPNAAALLLVALAPIALASCQSKPQSESQSQTQSPSQTQTASGTIKIDGSSTVFPITEAVAEEFQIANPGTRVTVGISGTGGGFKKFIAGEIDISDASRPISASEIEGATAAGLQFIELPIAYDGLSIVVNPKNTFCNSITVEELKKIWQPESSVKMWSDVRPDWPAKPLNLYGPGHDSGTFDYFTEAIVGKAKSSRADYTASEDDNVLVQGVEGDENALGFFGFAYYMENKDRLKIVGVDAGHGAVLPSEQTINDGTYSPLSRPVFIYVSTKSADRPEVKSFVNFFLNDGPALVKEVGYVPLPAAVYDLARVRFSERKTGTVFGGEGHKVGMKLEELIAAR